MGGPVVPEAAPVSTNVIQIALEVESNGETLAGRARCNGTSREFAGRIGLMALVDSLVDEARTDAGDQTKDGETDADS